MKRSQILGAIKVAAYHNDERTALRLYVENRVSYEAFKVAMREGRQAKAAGMKCTCYECNPPA